MLVWYRCHSMILYTNAVSAVIWHRPHQAAVHHYKPKSVLRDQSIKTWKATANTKVWCVLWFITYRLNCLSVSVCAVCPECVNHKKHDCFVADDETTVTLNVCLVEESEHICTTINGRDWERPPAELWSTPHLRWFLCLCAHKCVFASACTAVFHRQSRLHAASVYGLCLYLCVCVLYIRRPQPGEGIDLLLRVLAELSGDFSGLGQLLR